MRKIRLLLFVLLTASFFEAVRGQFYYNGRGPMDTRWMQTKSPDYKLIYPDEFAPTARGMSFFLDSIAQGVRHGFGRKPQRLPVILYTRNLHSNGEVVWAPKRTELMTPSPTGGLHADLWLKQLAVHEMRHNAQLSNLRGGLTKALSILFGQAGTSIGMLTLSKWYLEGDAVLAETRFSEFGRGLQPEFTVRMRAFLAADSSRIRMKTDRWSCGSYKHFTPGIYEFGYQMVAAGERYFGTDMWGRAVEYAGKYPILFVPMRIYMQRQYGTGAGKLAERALKELYHWWEPYSAEADSYTVLTKPGRSYTTYADPVIFRPNDGAGDRYVATRTDYDTPVRFVTGSIDGTEAGKTAAWIAPPSSRPIVDDRSNTLYWTEYKPHAIWEFKNFSIVRSLNLDTGERGKTFGRRQAHYFVTPIRKEDDGELLFATVSPDVSGGSDIIISDAQFQELWRVKFPTLTSLHGLAWDARTRQLVFIALDERGMWLGAATLRTEDGIVELRAPSMVTVSGLRGDGNGRVWFSSIRSGKDEIHEYNLETGVERRVTQSRFGAYTPAPGYKPGELLLVTHTSEGAMLAHANIAPRGAAPSDPIAWSRLPENLLNIPGPRWDVPKMSDFSILEAGADSSAMPHKTKRYNKALRWFNVHSWVPGVGLDAEKIIDERSLSLAFGASLFFQSAMGDSYGGVGYGCLQGEHWVNGNWTYAGLPVKFEVSTEYGGGKQDVYRGAGTFFADLNNYWRVSIEASVPVNLSGGSNSRLLQPAFRVTHYNALLLDPETTKLSEGYQKYTASLWWSSNRRMALRGILPRLGYALRADVTGTFDAKFGTVYGLFARGYLPGFRPEHTLTLKAGGMYQTEGRWNFNQKPIFPRGIDNRWSAKRYAGAAVDYTFPVWYPDGGINGLIYFKRIWMNLFGDYGKGDYFTSRSGVTAPLKYHSYGTDVAFEFNLISSDLSTVVKVTLANTSDSGLYMGAGLSLNF